MKAPLVSIIMPAYNAERYIREAIDSILAQTYGHFELLICDDGSTDGTAEVIRSYADPRIRAFFNGTNIGNLKTSNFLFAQCMGEFIGIQDADDVSTADRIELTMRAFADDPELGIVGTNYMRTDAAGNELYCGLVSTAKHDIQKRMESEVPPLLCASILVRKEIADRVGYYRPFFDRKGYADFDWIYRICEVANAANIPQIGYYYREQDQSFTAKRSEQEGLWSGYLMHKALVHAHHQRMSGESDLFDTPNSLMYRRYASKLLKSLSEQSYWAGDKSKALLLLKKSILASPTNFDAWRTLFYICKN